MDTKLHCKTCKGVLFRPGFFDKKCKCHLVSKEKEYYSTTNDSSEYFNGVIDGMIIDDIVDSIFDD